jgi:phospholipase D
MQAGNKMRSRSVAVFLVFVSLLWSEILNGKTIVLFSPDDKPTSHLINHINNAKKRIYAAVYMLTDIKIALALINAKKRNVDVQVIVDYCSIASSYGKAKILKQNGIKTFVYKIPNHPNQKYLPLMHNKFAIIDDKVWTGSFNWTISANRKNQENVVYNDEKDVYEKFLEQFEKLKQRCVIKSAKQSFKQKPVSWSIKSFFVSLWNKILSV